MQQNSRLKQVTHITNIVLGALYALVILGIIFSYFFGELSTLDDTVRFIIGVFLVLGFFVLIPASIVSIRLSAENLKKGKEKFSFIIQFVPVPLIVIMIVLLKLMASTPVCVD